MTPYHSTLAARGALAHRVFVASVVFAFACVSPARAQLSQKQKLVAPDGIAGNSFGIAVDASPDRLVVGAAHAPGASAGAAYVYTRQPDDTWTFDARISVGTAITFGDRVAIWNDRVAVRTSLPGVAGGTVLTFDRVAGTWTQSGLFSAPNFTEPIGDVAVGPTDLAMSAGHKVYTMKPLGFGWTYSQTLTPPAGLNVQSIAIGEDVLVVGEFESSGSAGFGDVAVYKRTVSGLWIFAQDLPPSDLPAGQHQNYGRNVALGDGVIVVDCDAGAYVYELVGATWTLAGHLPNTGVPAASGKRAYLAHPATNSIDVRERQPDASWPLLETEVPGDGVAGDTFGAALATRAGQLVVGSPQDDDLGGESGSVYVETIVPPLTIDRTTLSLSSGGVVNFTLTPGLPQAGRIYWTFGSLTGTAPGLSIGLLHLPLNQDNYLLFTMASPNVLPLVNSLNVLDAAGHGAAAFVLVPVAIPTLAGTQVSHAFITLKNANPAWVSNAQTFTLVP